MSTNRAYWNEADQKHIYLYVSSTVKETKDRYFTLLYPTLTKLIDTISFKHNFRLTDDDKQNIMVRLYEYVLPKIKPDKVQAAYAYIYTAISNLSRNEVRTKNGKYAHDKASLPLSSYSGYELSKDIDSLVSYIGDKQWLDETFRIETTVDEAPETVEQAIEREIRLSAATRSHDITKAG